jgi:hypothetical protein
MKAFRLETGIDGIYKVRHKLQVICNLGKGLGSEAKRLLGKLGGKGVK